ncbi:MAG: ABC transporter permease [Bacteroidota bacterium]
MHPQHRPPAWADRFLEWFCDAELIDEIQGDLHEDYQRYATEKGHFRADVKYVWDVLRFFRPSSFSTPRIYWYPVMLKNYFTSAMRNFGRQKAFTFINMLGLSVGLACSMFILLWVQDELSYNAFHQEGDQLHRLMRHVSFSSGETYTWSAVPMPSAKLMEQEIPEILDAELMPWDDEVLVSKGDSAFRENGRYADQAFFSIFSFPLLEGNAEEVLTDPSGVVISETVAEKFFGSGWQATGILGQTLRIDQNRDVKITGVFADISRNSSIQGDLVFPIKPWLDDRPWLEHWGNNSLEIYLRLTPDAEMASVNQKIQDLMDRNMEGNTAVFFAQPFEDMYLWGEYRDGKLVGGRIDYVNIFGFVSLFLILIAAINFMNLSTARSGLRAREIGIRKVAGAQKGALVQQFLGESLILAMLATGLAVLMVELLLPSFNEIVSKEISISYADPRYLLSFLGLGLFTGILSGIYPAFVLSSFNIVQVLKGNFSTSTKGGQLRKGLVVFQFALSILLIIGTLTTYSQIQYIQNKNLGLDKDNLVYLPMEGAVESQFAAFKAELLKQEGILGVSAASQNPLRVGNSTSDPTWPGKDPEAALLFSIINTKLDFVETMKMKMKEGRTHQASFGTDTLNYVINEAAAKAIGVENPIGLEVEFWEQKGQVIGVVEDFHFSSLRSKIDPLIMRYDPDETWLVYVRLEGGKLEEGLASLEKVYNEFNPTYPFSYTFLDEHFQRTYRSEFTIGKLANAFATIAIFISCLGLFGLASFTAERRTREIGIRKVLGASTGKLVLLLSLDFTKLVGIAFLIAAPIAYYVMDRWLGGYEYHVPMQIWVFALAGLVSLLIAWLTIGYQSIRTAMADPVKSLRTE